jgi:saccharopine dehydrogenase-like NADP-dependent oxidoreductase
VRIAILGAGAMGGAAARLLARHDDAELLVIDADGDQASAVATAVGRAEARGFDAAAGGEALAAALAGADAVAACLPYRLNLDAMEAALAARVPYADRTRSSTSTCSPRTCTRTASSGRSLPARARSTTSSRRRSA